MPDGFDMAEILENREFFIEDGEYLSIARIKNPICFPLFPRMCLLLQPLEDHGCSENRLNRKNGVSVRENRL
jgi:hypothetical protein